LKHLKKSVNKNKAKQSKIKTKWTDITVISTAKIDMKALPLPAN